MRLCAALLLLAACSSSSPKPDDAAGPAPTPARDPMPVSTSPPTDPVVTPPEPGEPLPEDPPAPPDTEEPEAARETLLAKVEIDDAPGYKHFQGVWLVTEDGTRHVIDYRARPWWEPFDEHRVEVKGVHYEPVGQAISSPHFRIASMKLLDPEPEDEVLSIGGEQTLVGEVVEIRYSREPGTGPMRALKLETGEHSYTLYQPPHPEPERGKQLTIQGRLVELTSTPEHSAGEHLWIDSVE